MRQHAFFRHAYGFEFDPDASSLEGSNLDGLHVVFDEKVGLHPANLQKATPGQKRPAPRPAGALSWHRRRHGRRH